MIAKNKEDITVLCTAGAFVRKIIHIHRKVHQAKTPLILDIKEYVWINKEKVPVVREPKTNNAFIQLPLSIHQW